MILNPPQFLSRACLVIMGLWWLSPASAPAQMSPEAQTRMHEQIHALMQDKAGRTAAQKKLDTQLVYAAREAAAGRAHEAAPRLHSTAQVHSDGSVALDLQGTITDELLAVLKDKGGQDFNAHPEANTVRVTLPLAAVEAVAERADVQGIRPADYGTTQTGSVLSEGEATHLASRARVEYGISGAGVKVGVISDSLDDSHGSFQAAVNSGDIDNAGLATLAGQAGTGSGEGLAMLEIIHDLAPDAKLVFATSQPSEAQMAANIRALASAGCQIIVDDVYFSDESPFQDSVVSQAVDDVTAKGVLYFSAAGNNGSLDQGTQSVWEGDFKDGGSAGATTTFGGERYHLFTGADGSTTTTNAIYARGVNDLTASLYWSDPLGKSSNDYDLFEVDGFGNVVASSQHLQNGTQDPYEHLSQITVGDYLVVVSDGASPRFLHLAVGRQILAVGTYGAVHGHAANISDNAFCVASTPAHGPYAAGYPSGPYPNPFNSSNVTELASSDGPRRMFYDRYGAPYTPGNFSSTGGHNFAKPDFTAADGVATTLPSNSGLNPFFGTSAAAPHAAALAALLISYLPSRSPATFGSALRGGAVQLTGTMLNSGSVESRRDSGVGILLAPNIIGTFASTPQISGFGPGSGPTGQTVDITGLNLGSVTSVNFNSAENASFTVYSNTLLHAVVSPSATSGPIYVTTVGGLAVSSASFVVTSPVITSAGTASGTNGQPFTYQVTATNSPTSFGTTGLTDGLSINASTGLISGTLNSGGTFIDIVVTATNSQGTGYKLVTVQVAGSPSFFQNQASVGNGVYYLAFPNGNFFGYYSYLSDPSYLYHFDLGYEYVFDANDGKSGVYLYDFKSGHFFYTSPTFPFPYLYDFSLNSVLYYYPDPNQAGHYDTNGVRYFYVFSTGKIISM